MKERIAIFYTVSSVIFIASDYTLVNMFVFWENVIYIIMSKRIPFYFLIEVSNIVCTLNRTS